METVIAIGEKYWSGSGFGSLQFAKVFKKRDSAVREAALKRLAGVEFRMYCGKPAPQGSRFHAPERRPNYYKGK